MRHRPLTPEELADARSVFHDTLPFDRVRITDLNLGSAVTVAGIEVPSGTHFYTIHWGADVFTRGVRAAGERSTLIHELTHVWQGEYGSFPQQYMAESVAAQLREGLRDAWRSGTRNPITIFKRWGDHRSTAYVITAADIGRDWKSFNVEQQGMLVQTWYVTERDRRLERVSGGPGVYGGGASEYDARFPYIRDVIRKRDRSAAYRPVELPRGADPQVKALQDKLVELGYLDARSADGLVGRSHSATLDAVRAFQARNGLKPDRDLGGSNSETRRKLGLPAQQLVRAPL